MTTEKPAHSSSNPVFGVACLIALLASCMGLFVSLFGALFGPDGLTKYGVIGFLLAIVGGVLSRWFPPAQPKGLTDSLPRLRICETFWLCWGEPPGKDS